MQGIANTNDGEATARNHEHLQAEETKGELWQSHQLLLKLWQPYLTGTGATAEVQPLTEKPQEVE